MSGFPYIFTFYSFKGGVGRSMAVLNTAYALASWGKHVLIVDMDLEAPGVSGFLHRHGEFLQPEADHPLDVLTLLGEVTSAVRSGKRASEAAKALPPLQNYIRTVAPAKLAPLAPRIGRVGRLDVLAADMDRNWCGRLAALGLQGMPQDRLIEVSSALHFYFKAHRFPHRPPGLGEDTAIEATPYDYILVDSRTGISEIGGMCVGPLADRLVVVSSLNDQNIEGTRTFLEEAGIKPLARHADATPWDEGDPAQDLEVPTLGPKPTMLVASPVPNGEIEFKRKRLQELEKRIGIRASRLSYHPQMALLESVFIRDFKEEYLAGEYFSLASSITRQASDHPSQLAASVSTRPSRSEDPFASIPTILRLASQDPELGQSLLTSFANFLRPQTDQEWQLEYRLHAALAELPSLKHTALFSWGNALSDQAETKDGAEADRLFAGAGEKYAASLKIKPDKHEALNNWGNALLAQAKTKKGAEADRLFAEAGEKYAASIKIKPDKHGALNNWGIALSEQARTKEGAEADWLFAEAYEKFAASIKIKPDEHEALNNWGIALSDQAEKKEGAEADRLFVNAVEKYTASLKFKPDQHEALNNWGNTLLSQAKTKEGDKADWLYARSFEKYSASLMVKPDQHEALNNWGNALSEMAETKGDAEADRLFALAGEKYTASLKIKPDQHDVFNNWGAALLNQAKTKKGSEAKQLFQQARDKLTAAEGLRVGSAAFNLACLESLLGSIPNAVRWLNAAVDAGEPPSVEDLETDSDFDRIREAPEFLVFVQMLRSRESKEP